MQLLIHNLKTMMIKRQNLNHLTTIRNKMKNLFREKLQKLQRKLLKKAKKLKKLKNLRTHQSKLKKKIYLITLHLFKPM
jgi:adenylate kinase